MLKIIDNKLSSVKLEWDERSAVCIVLAAGGYPGSYKKGTEIEGLDMARNLDDLIVFHAGTKEIEGKITTSGGRVLNVVGIGKDIKSAIAQGYKGVSCIKFDGMQYRTDIGKKALKR